MIEILFRTKFLHDSPFERIREWRWRESAEQIYFAPIEVYEILTFIHTLAFIEITKKLYLENNLEYSYMYKCG